MPVPLMQAHSSDKQGSKSIDRVHYGLRVTFTYKHSWDLNASLLYTDMNGECITDDFTTQSSTHDGV
jgi:hypothetical protein